MRLSTLIPRPGLPHILENFCGSEEAKSHNRHTCHPADRSCGGHFDTAVWNYFECDVSVSGSSGDSRRDFGDDESISKNSETISNPAIPAPMIMCVSFYLFLFQSYCLPISMHACGQVLRPVSSRPLRLSLVFKSAARLLFMCTSLIDTFHLMQRMYGPMPSGW